MKDLCVMAQKRYFLDKTSTSLEYDSLSNKLGNQNLYPYRILVLDARIRGTRLKTQWIILIAAFLTPCMISSANAEQPSLDGQRYSIMVGEHGKKFDTPHTLIFENGQMSSLECDAYGFGAAKYTVEQHKSGIRFSTELPSENEGSMLWTGTVRGNHITGESTWQKAGQNPMHYQFRGTRSD